MPGSLPSYQSLGEGPRQSCFESSSSKSVRVESHWAGVLLFSFFLLGQGFLCTMKPQLLVTESSLWNSVCNKHFMVGSRQLFEFCKSLKRCLYILFQHIFSQGLNTLVTRGPTEQSYELIRVVLGYQPWREVMKVRCRRSL